MSPERPEAERAAKPRCPICGEPASTRERPFCSPRCADVDLQRWLAGTYALPVVEDRDEAEDESGLEER